MDPKEYQEFVDASKKYDASIQKKIRVINSGSGFTVDNVSYNNSCGWLSVHTALSLLYFLGVKLPYCSLRYGSSPYDLKKINTYSGKDSEISDVDFKLLSVVLDVVFHIHEPGGAVRVIGNKTKISIDIHINYYSRHYTLPIAIYQQFCNDPENYENLIKEFSEERSILITTIGEII